jgi:tetratricopeptide (TPR) repeat protein
MHDLRVFFAAGETDYHARLSDAGGNELGVAVPFTPFLTEDDYEDLRWYLEDYMDLPDGGAVTRAERIERNLEVWGRKLYDALFTAEENRSLLSRLLAGPEPRELTIATKDPLLLQLPWELMADEAGSLAQRLSVRRQLEQPEATTPRPAQLPLRILYIVSRPADAGFIDPRMTAKALLDALDPLGASVRVDFCRPPTLERMKEMLRDGQQAGAPYGLVHFDGHGTFLPKAQTGALLFERPEDGSGAAATDFVEAGQLGRLLASYAIPLVVLEACRSAKIGKTDVFRSVAPRLVQAGVGSVLAMSHAVHVEAARLLLDRFYRELVRGTTLGKAMAEAREALRSTPVRWIESGPDGRTIKLCDWFLPHLYQNAADEALIPSCTSADAENRLPGFRSPASRGEPGSFPSSPQFGFRGRARELHDLERLFRTHRGIVLHAMGGMGKTALAAEAAHWWTRSGLFRDGACFLSFEQFASADRAVQVLGTYLDGPGFDQLPAVEQHRRAIELFQQEDVLMVWDNFESALPQFNDGAAVHGSPYTDDERRRLAELFCNLTTGPGRGRLLVTCRPGDTNLPDAQRYELQGLARADSLWLLSSILQRDGLTLADPRLGRDKLEPLLRDLADHPLSLELVGPHLRTLTPEEIRADFGKLLAKLQQEAPEGRNQSLLASLEFSRRHLSPAAREALPWLGLFRGGVFEYNLLYVSQLAVDAWEPIRRELQGIALLRTEDDFQVGGRPFLSFHPTLASAAADPTLAQNLETRQRFIDFYRGLMQVLHEALMGSQARDALEILNREEENYRTAVQWAVTDQQLPAAATLGHMFRNYLQISGRLRERDTWVQWLKDADQRGFTEEAAAYEQEHAWTRFTRGDHQGAVDQLQALIERLRHTTEFDPEFQLAQAVGYLGKVLDHAGASAQAVPILWEAVGLCEVLVEKAEGRPWQELLVSLASPDHAKTASQLSIISVSMGDLANALSSAGQQNEALAVAEKALFIYERSGSHREVASGHFRCASILMAAGRYDEAGARYDLALAAVHQAGDKRLEGSILQGQGKLADYYQQSERATRLYQQALKLSREASDQGSIMRTYNLLGETERKAGRLAEARAWYEKSRELAVQLKDQVSLGAVAQNIGIVWQLEGGIARERGDEPAARRYFEEARHSVAESLQIEQACGNKLAEGDSWSQLARIYFLLGDLAAAEHHAHEAREIRESLGLKEAWKDYNTLAAIAHAHGDFAAAAEWAKTRDDLLAELERRAG